METTQLFNKPREMDSVSMISDTGTISSEMTEKIRDEMLKLRTKNHDLTMEKLELELEIKRIEVKMSVVNHGLEERQNFQHQIDLYEQKLKNLERNNQTLRSELEHKEENICVLETENRQMLDIVRFPLHKNGSSSYWAYTSACTIL